MREFPTHLFLICLDIIRFRLGDYVIESKPKVNERRNFLRVFFHSKGIEMVNLSCRLGWQYQIFSRIRIRLSFLIHIYTKPIGPTIFNFRKVAQEHDINEPLNDQCACKQSNFRYQPLGHVITGDLRVIKNKTLTNLIPKGPNYREQNNIDWDLCHKLCMDGINHTVR